MKRNISVLILSLILLLSPAQALAYNFFDHGICNDASSSAVCTDKNSPTNPLFGTHSLIFRIANIIAFVAGAAAVIMLIVSGIRFINSSGDTEKVKAARSTATNALIGIAVIILATTLIDFVLSRL